MSYLKRGSKVLVTGGDGFIGGHLVNMLKQFPDIEVVVFDKKRISPTKVFDQHWDCIYHLAASTYLVEGYDEDIIKDNIILSQKIKELNQRTVYASSASVYHLNNLYAYSKKFNEEQFANSNATGLRFYNVYGPNDNGVVGKIIKAVLKGEPIPLYGDGSQSRDFIYVDDVVDVMLSSSNCDQKIIEVGTGVSTTIMEVINMVVELSGSKGALVNYLEAKKGEQFHSVCPTSTSNLIKLKTGLLRTIDYYKNL